MVQVVGVAAAIRSRGSKAVVFGSDNTNTKRTRRLLQVVMVGQRQDPPREGTSRRQYRNRQSESKFMMMGCCTMDAVLVGTCELSDVLVNFTGLACYEQALPMRLSLDILASLS